MQAYHTHRPLDDYDPETISVCLTLLRLIRAGTVSRFVANTEGMSFASLLDDLGYIDLEVDPDMPPTLDGEVYRVAERGQK